LLRGLSVVASRYRRLDFASVLKRSFLGSLYVNVGKILSKARSSKQIPKAKKKAIRNRLAKLCKHKRIALSHEKFGESLGKSRNGAEAWFRRNGKNSVPEVNVFIAIGREYNLTLTGSCWVRGSRFEGKRKHHSRNQSVMWVGQRARQSLSVLRSHQFSHKWIHQAGRTVRLATQSNGFFLLLPPMLNLRGVTQ